MNRFSQQNKSAKQIDTFSVRETDNSASIAVARKPGTDRSASLRFANEQVAVFAAQMEEHRKPAARRAEPSAGRM